MSEREEDQLVVIRPHDQSITMFCMDTSIRGSLRPIPSHTYTYTFTQYHRKSMKFTGKKKKSTLLLIHRDLNCAASVAVTRAPIRGEKRRVKITPRQMHNYM